MASTSLLSNLLFMGGIGGWELFVMSIFIIGVIVLPIVALIDILTGTFDGLNKILWVIIILFVPYIGSILYFIIGRKKRMKAKNPV